MNEHVRKPKLFILVLVTLFCGVANVRAQESRVTVNVENASLKDVFRAIENQTTYRFSYRDVVVGSEKNINFSKTATVPSILNDLLAGRNLAYNIVSPESIVITDVRRTPPPTAQQGQEGRKNVSGIVADTNGNPVIGASVVEVGNPRNGTVTNSNGSFSLEVPGQAALTISYFGFLTQEITVGNSTLLDIVLREDSQLLDEVVVVGYGTVRKVNLTGAVDQVGSEVLEARPITSVAQALQGTMPNLNIAANTGTGTNGGGAPGARMSFNIRGISGLSSGSGATLAGPLFVIDGVQGQDINAINPNDIESVSVLKDAASAAIYGSNAPYGVVLVTTKKGSRTGKPTVSYNTSVGWQSPINMPRMMNSVDWANLMNEASENSNRGSFFSESNMQRIQDYYDGKITTPTIKDPSGIVSESWASFNDTGNGRSNDNVEWYSALFKKQSFYQQHNLSLSGGADRATYYVGLGYNDRDGVLKYGDDSFKRYSIRANLSSQVTDWFTANFRGSFTRGINDRPSNTGNDNFMQQIAQKWPIIPMKNNDGNWSENSNIGHYLNGGRNISKDNVGVVTGEFVITPVKGWNTTFNYSYTSNNITNERNSLHVTMYDANGIPYFSPGWEWGEQSYTRSADYLYRQRIDDTRHTVNLFSEYEFNLNGNHYLKAMAGFTQELVHYYSLTADSGKRTLYNVDIPTFPMSYYDENTTTVGEPNKQTLATRGVFGRINYGYKDRYLLELNGRYDGSSRYQKDVRFKFYPGVSAGWIVSSENFWGDRLRSAVDFFKVRASYGQLGEQSGGYYPFYPSLGLTASTGSNWYFDGARHSAISNPGIVNPNLTWITSTTIDVGADMYMLHGRMRASFDWYSRTSSNVVGPAQELPAVLGVAAPSTNNAELRTRGFELSLEWRDYINSIDLSYGVKATLANSKSVVMKYPNEKQMIGTWYPGAVIGNIWGYETERYYEVGETIDQNVQGNPKGLGSNWSAGDIKYRDLNGDGLITYGDNTLNDPGDRKVIGNSLPRYTYGVTLDAAWRGLDISAFLQGVGKRDAWISTGGPGQFWGTTNSEWQANFLTIHNDRWTPETPNGYYAKYYLDGNNAKNQQVQTKYLQNAAYLRFKNLQIGYTMPERWMSKAGITKLRVFASFENLLTITKFVETIDPEFAGLDRGLGYPLQRTSSFGVSLTF